MTTSDDVVCHCRVQEANQAQLVQEVHEEREELMASPDSLAMTVTLESQGEMEPQDSRDFL